MFSLTKISQSLSGTFAWLLVWFILGVALASGAEISQSNLFWLYLFLWFWLIALIVFWPKLLGRLIILAGIFLFLGLARFAISEPAIESNNLRFYNGRLVEIIGLVSVEPAQKDNQQSIVIEGRQLNIVNLKDKKTLKPLKGRAILYLSLYPEYHYGDELKVICELVEPYQGKDFDYPAFLARQGVWSVCQNPRVEKLSERKGSPLMGFILKTKMVFARQVSRLLPEPQAAFLGGLLYGARSAIPENLQQSFNRTGTTHILAISGYNITIIAAALLVVLKGMWLPRKKAFWFTAGGLIFFILLTGAGSSVVRAGLMGIIVLLARQVGRLSHVGRVMLLAAALMLLINPRVLFFDAGFQLSFAATLALVYLAPLLIKYFERWPTIFGLQEAAVTTFSAIVATLPLSLYQFGRFSLVAPLANLLILPVIPLSMALGFGAVSGSFLFFPLGQLFGILAWAPLTYIIKVTEFLAGWSGSAVAVSKLPWWGMAAAYLGLILIVMKLNKTEVSKQKEPPRITNY